MSSFPFWFLISDDKIPAVLICLWYSMDVLKSLASSAKTWTIELFMDVNDIELFEESLRKEKEEAEAKKKEGGSSCEKLGRAVEKVKKNWTWNERKVFWLKTWPFDYYLENVNEINFPYFQILLAKCYAANPL